MSIRIEGLSPAISIEQKTTSKNPRSTVGTVTEIYDYMRLLWARIGVPYSPATGLPIESQTVQPDGRPQAWRCRKAQIDLLAPVIRGRKGEYKKEFAGPAQARLPAREGRRRMHELEDPPNLDKKLKHDIDVVVDRIVIKEAWNSAWPNQLETPSVC
jgi:excinuclease ABC subunit A